MPCMELFDIQQKNIKKKYLITTNSFYFRGWYFGKNIKVKRLLFWKDKFGESAPYKKIYEHFGLTEDRILNVIQKHLRK